MSRKTWTAVALVAVAVAHPFRRSETELQKKLGAPRQTGSGGVLGRIVLVCAAITAGAGALILVGWAFGSDALTAMGTGYIPAPNTALLFALLGSAVLVREVWPASRVIRRIATAAAVFSAVVGSVTLIGLVIGLNIDDWLFRTTRMLGEVPMGRMSPVTALCFVLAGVSLLLLECQAGAWAAILGTLITLVGAVCLMGYGFGAPLLYGGSVIPVALPASLALVALGIGLTAAAGPHTWPLNILLGPSTRARLLRALLPTVVLLALIHDWITAVLLEHSDPGVVLASAMTAVSFLLVVGFVVSWVSRAIGDAIDRTQAELTHAVEALRESEEKYRRIYDSLQDVYVETALDGTILEISPRVETLSGGQYKREDVLGRSANAFYADAERRAAFLRTLTLLGSVKDFESTFLNRDGSVVPCSISAMIRQGADGKPGSIVSTVRDISGRKRAQESLRESEERLLAIFEGAVDGILVTDAESKKFLTGNSAICRMLGYTLEEIVRIGVSDIHPKQDLPRAMAEIERRQRGESQVVADIPVMRKDGSVFYADIRSAPIRLGGRNCLLGHFRDVTERKHAQETQAKLAAIVESSNDAIIGRALDGTVTSWNATAERILGYTVAETIGRDPVGIFPPLWQQLIAKNRKLVRAGQIVPNHETVYIAKDGRHIDFAVSLSAIKDNSGRIIGTATTLRDITERKRTEQVLHDNAKRLRSLSWRLFTAAETERRNINRELHDRVGASLSALNLNLSILRSQLPQESLRAVGARLEDTQKLLEETTAHVRDLMADLHPPALDDYGLLAALRTYVESLGARLAVPISVHGEALVPRLPLAAETALFRVAQGALVNTVKHAQAKRIEILLAATTDRVALTIADDGVGFDVAQAAQAHASWGLAIMRERAAAVGAKLTVESTPGKGTRVCVEISREKS